MHRFLNDFTILHVPAHKSIKILNDSCANEGFSRSPMLLRYYILYTTLNLKSIEALESLQQQFKVVKSGTRNNEVVRN